MLRSAIGKLDAWYLDYVAGLSQADGEAVLVQLRGWRQGQMSRTEMLLHLVTHGGYHRGRSGAFWCSAASRRRAIP